MRNKRLDILRCIAVFAVMLSHSGDFVHLEAGWAGVDLFFVLSGFLISGLLFTEYKKRGVINGTSLKRFFVRRGLKIYPPFYAFLLLTYPVLAFYLRAGVPLRSYLHEVFFIMNYRPGIWEYSWSLAVEEHFYIFLPLFLFLLVRLSRQGDDPFRAIPFAAVMIAVLCIAFRGYATYLSGPEFHITYVGTHDRMDALFCGVCVGYLYHFRPATLDRLMGSAWNRLVIAAASVALLSSIFLYKRSTSFFTTFGFSFVYLGFAGVLLLSLYVHGLLRGRVAGIAAAIGSAAAYVGAYSYSVYLWHGPSGAWLPGLFRRTLGHPTSGVGRFAVYVVGSFVVGITMSKLIEYPILRLRDRWMPAVGAPPVAVDGASEPAPTFAALVPSNTQVP